MSMLKSTYLERVDDVKDEMISNIGLGDFGSRLLLIGQETWCFYRNICYLMQQNTKHRRIILLVITIFKTAFALVTIFVSDAWL